MQTYTDEYFLFYRIDAVERLIVKSLNVSRSSLAYCRVWPGSTRVYFASAKKNLVLKAATI